MEKPLKDYEKNFSIVGLWKKIGQISKKAGVKVIYTVLLLFYAYRRKDTPRWAKNIVIGTLGYLISPIDAIPDLTPVLGYTDDIGILSFGLVTIAAHINKEVKDKAKNTLGHWFKDYDQSEIEEVDQQF